MTGVGASVGPAVGAGDGAGDGAGVGASVRLQDLRSAGGELHEPMLSSALRQPFLDDSWKGALKNGAWLEDPRHLKVQGSAAAASKKQQPGAPMRSQAAVQLLRSAPMSATDLQAILQITIY